MITPTPGRKEAGVYWGLVTVLSSAVDVIGDLLSSLRGSLWSSLCFCACDPLCKSTPGLLRLIHWEWQQVPESFWPTTPPTPHPQGRPLANNWLAEEYKKLATVLLLCLKVRQITRCNVHSEDSLRIMPKLGPCRQGLRGLASFCPHCPSPNSLAGVSCQHCLAGDHHHINLCLRICFCRIQPKTTSTCLWAIFFFNHIWITGCHELRGTNKPLNQEKRGKEQQFSVFSAWLNLLGFQDSTFKISQNG